MCLIHTGRSRWEIIWETKWKEAQIFHSKIFSHHWHWKQNKKKEKQEMWLMRGSHFIEKDPPVSLPVSGSRKESFRQHSVGRPTSYLMPTIFINSCSWTRTADKATNSFVKMSDKNTLKKLHFFYVHLNIDEMKGEKNHSQAVCITVSYVDGETTFF